MVSYLLGKRHTHAARSVVNRMLKEGFVVSDENEAFLAGIEGLEAQERVFQGGSEDVEGKLMDESLQKMSGLFEKLSEDSIASLLKTLRTHGATEEFLAALVGLYAQRQGEAYHPRSDLLGYVALQAARAGDLQAALDLLTSRPSLAEKAKERDLQRTFVDVLSVIRDKELGGEQLTQRVVEALSKIGVRPDTAMFNVLLSREVRMGYVDEALGLYDVMQSLSGDLVLPDEYTYGSMFALHRTVVTRIARNHSSANVLRPEDCRKVFQDMWKDSRREAYPVQLSTPLLNVALKAFLRHRDYAGAHSVLSMFSERGVQVDHRTWYSVVKAVIRRLFQDLGSKDAMLTWGQRFLGVEGRTEIDEEMVEYILELVARNEFSVKTPFWPPSDDIMALPAGYEIPSMEMMHSQKRPEPLDFEYPAVPLMRLLERAILAEKAPGTVRSALARARREMDS